MPTSRSSRNRSAGNLRLENLFAEAEERHGVRVADGIQLLGAGALVRSPFDPAIALLVVSDPGRAPGTGPGPGGAPSDIEARDFEPPVLPGRAAHDGSPSALLRRLYPPDHPVLGLGGASDATVADLTDEALADGRLLLPPLDPERDLASPHGLAWLVARLRAPGGCPWDREQTHLTLRKFLLEEAYEVYDALEDGSTPALAEELGDLLLQIVLHAHYGAEAGVFDLADVHHAIMTKIIRRHPHVFGGVEARSVDQVLRNWELIKADERATRSAERPRGPAREAGERPGMPEAFAGLSTALPALAYAQEIQERAASLGYDWPQIVDIAEKVDEEVAELVAAVDETARREEVGDLLLVIVNLARRLGVDAEAALRRASAKFAARFAHVERLAADRGVDLRELDLDALDELWQAAKRVERDAVGMR